MKHNIDQRPTDWREGRRLRAWELAQQGWKQTDIAAALGVTHGAISQWLTRAVLRARSRYGGSRLLVASPS
jgi:DNA-directed RNA polymerase specialized sigma24 family protein